jgi:RHS repeat-associated protein
VWRLLQSSLRVLLNAAMREFDLQPITRPAATIFSPASFVKGYFDAMGLTPPSQKFDVPNEILGNAGLGRLSQVVQNGSRTRTFSYDSLSQLLTSNNPETGTITYTYNPDGTLLTKKDARGITICHGDWSSSSSTCNGSTGYDGLHRELKITYSNADPTLSFTYDQSGCLGLTACHNIGHRTSMTDGAGSEHWAYEVDKTNNRNIHRDQRTNSSIIKTTTYYLDFQGNVTQIVYPTGRTVNYAYDSANRPSSASDASNGITYVAGWKTPPAGTNCTAGSVCYIPQGSVYGMSVGQSSSYTGLDLLETFNNRLQPNKMEAGNGSTAFNVTYNFLDPVSGKNSGHVYGIIDNANSGLSQTFTYDQLNRITSAGTAATSGLTCWGYQYTYDAWGNLLSQAGWTPTYNACTEYMMGAVTADGNNRVSGFSYDASGNTQSDGVYSYTWDAESQLKTAGGVTYTYDGDGRRAAKVGSKLYWYGSGGEILAETDASWKTLQDYVYFGKERVALVPASGTTLLYAEDFLGSSRLIMQSDGTLCYYGEFTPYGAEVPIYNGCPQNYKFEGKERDTETANDNFGAREYSLRSGRWLSSDWSAVPVPVPYANLTNPQTLNLYAMAADDPTSFADLDGHDCPPCVAVIEDIFAFAGEGAKDGAVAGPEGALIGAGLGLGIGVVANGGGRSPAGYVPGGSLTDENGNSIFQMSKQGNASNAQSSQTAPPASQSTPAQPEPPSGNDLNRSSTTKQTGAQGQNTETTVKDAAGSTTYKTTPGKTGGQSTIVVRKDENGNTVYVKQEARTNNKDFTKPPDHVHYKKPIDKEVN